MITEGTRLLLGILATTIIPLCLLRDVSIEDRLRRPETTVITLVHPLRAPLVTLRISEAGRRLLLLRLATSLDLAIILRMICPRQGIPLVDIPRLRLLETTMIDMSGGHPLLGRGMDLTLLLALAPGQGPRLVLPFPLPALATTTRGLRQHVTILHRRRKVAPAQ